MAYTFTEREKRGKNPLGGSPSSLFPDHGCLLPSHYGKVTLSPEVKPSCSFSVHWVQTISPSPKWHLTEHTTQGCGRLLYWSHSPAVACQRAPLGAESCTLPADHNNHLSMSSLHFFLGSLESPAFWSPFPTRSQGESAYFSEVVFCLLSFFVAFNFPVRPFLVPRDLLLSFFFFSFPKLLLSSVWIPNLRETESSLTTSPG